MLGRLLLLKGGPQSIPNYSHHAPLQTLVYTEYLNLLLPPIFSSTLSQWGSQGNSTSPIKVSDDLFIIKSKQSFRTFLLLNLSQLIAVSYEEYFLSPIRNTSCPWLSQLSLLMPDFPPTSDHSCLHCRFILLKSNQGSHLVPDCLLRDPLLLTASAPCLWQRTHSLLYQV